MPSCGTAFLSVVFTHCGCERVKESEITKCISVPDPHDPQSIDDGWECPIDTLFSRTGFRACVISRSGVILKFLRTKRDSIRGTACIGYKTSCCQFPRFYDTLVRSVLVLLRTAQFPGCHNYKTSLTKWRLK
jgi:hypothetical protein